MFEMTTGILNFMKGSFNPFARARNPAIQRGWILLKLVGSFGGDNLIASGYELRPLPLFADESFVTDDGDSTDLIQHRVLTPINWTRC